VKAQMDTPVISSGRRLDPEWLDELPPEDPRAVGSRKDLQRLNRIMSHVPFLVDVWRRNRPDRWIETIVELGAGDGTFLLEFARAMAPASRPYRVILVDRLKAVPPKTLDEFRALGWTASFVQADVFEWLRSCQVSEAALVANLFLHHFEEERLRLLLEGIALRANLFIALEPRRCLGGVLASHLVGLIGCNPVTRHDAVASVHAGFKGKELSALWPGRGWYMQETEIGPFSHCFSAFSSVPRPA